MKAKGYIIDSSSKEPLSRATILVTDSEGNPTGNKTTANDNGEFEIEVMPADFITTTYIGYSNKTIPVKKISSERYEIKMRYLKPGQVTIDLMKSENEGGLTNDPIKWYYWLGFAFIGYYAYTKIKK